MAKHTRARIPGWARWLGGRKLESFVTLARWAGLDIDGASSPETTYQRLDRERSSRRKMRFSTLVMSLVLVLLMVVGIYLMGDRQTWPVVVPLVLFALCVMCFLALGPVLRAFGIRFSESTTVNGTTSSTASLVSAPRGIPTLRAHAVNSDDPCLLRSTIESVALAAGISPPAAYVVETAEVNAFVLSGTRNHPPVIGATRGLAQLLTARELATVVAPLVVRLRRERFESGSAPDAWFSEDTEALLLHRDPEAMLSAYRKVLSAQTVLGWAWNLGPETFFSYDNPLTQALFTGIHPRLQRLEGILAEANRDAI